MGWGYFHPKRTQACNIAEALSFVNGRSESSARQWHAALLTPDEFEIGKANVHVPTSTDPTSTDQGARVAE